MIQNMKTKFKLNCINYIYLSLKIKIDFKIKIFSSGFSVVPIPLQSSVIQLKDESALLGDGISDKLASLMQPGSLSNLN